MADVTIAHQPTTTTNEIVSESRFPDSPQTVDEEQLNHLLAGSSADWPNNVPVEDLTGEVQELMMRESMSSWLQPWVAENANCLVGFDAQMYAQSLQLEDLFGQDQLNFTQNITPSAFYDEITFVPDDASLQLSASASSASSPSDSSAQVSPIVESATTSHLDQLEQEQGMIVEKLDVLEKEEIEIEEIQVDERPAMEVVNTLKRRRDSSSSESSSDDDSSSSSGSESESDSDNEPNVIPTTVANMNSRGRMNYSSSSDSDSDTEVMAGRRSRAVSPASNPYIYMHKRQIEETLLDRITNQLHPEKLPGILPILSSEKASSQHEDEVEIDLSCLAREQLVQVLSYVDACILEQNGGPAVRVEDYIQKKPIKKGPRTRPALIEEPRKRRPAKQRRRPIKPKSRSLAELTEDIDAGSSSSDESSEEELAPKSKRFEGPMSMASLSKSNGSKSRNNKKSGKKCRTRRRDEDATVSSSVTVIQDPNSIASSRPKRRAAVHKRRLLEEMLAPSDNEEEDDDDDSPLIVFGDEKMDFGVVDNCTITHQVPVISTQSEVVVVAATVHEDECNEDTDEEIDIMF
ncbi:uncharacterized protein B0P05DRAFT_541945 [Gilbertella persicaria]|uniref:uncharacterized protein n=1 Tax=Gilbertella persicaria TaxID=101096 RepID=UPI002220545F|nr:uncharacterized protein B0P05DRAFT_541945 [Gilbertella persicaria]KAI8078985.1 hypothetical protein B0P05DRAFT_541945 [Gilbertella persicaria]